MNKLPGGFVCVWTFTPVPVHKAVSLKFLAGFFKIIQVNQVTGAKRLSFGGWGSGAKRQIPGAQPPVSYKLDFSR